jgi:hypothetical protein
MVHVRGWNGYMHTDMHTVTAVLSWLNAPHPHVARRRTLLLPQLHCEDIRTGVITPSVSLLPPRKLPCASLLTQWPYTGHSTHMCPARCSVLTRLARWRDAITAADVCTGARQAAAAARWLCRQCDADSATATACA